jgi:hypothetical protein
LTVIVGDSSKARKGTSAGPVETVFKGTDNSCRVTPGPLSTGEGIIYAVRDEQIAWVIDKKNKLGEWQVTDPGVDDKRLLVIDEEFAAALQCTKREGNTLSSVIRTLFDSGNAEPLTKSNRTKEPGAIQVQQLVQRQKGIGFMLSSTPLEKPATQQKKPIQQSLSVVFPRFLPLSLGAIPTTALIEKDRPDDFSSGRLH